MIENTYWMGVSGAPIRLLTARDRWRMQVNPRNWLLHARRRKDEAHSVERFDFVLDRAVEINAVVIKDTVNLPTRDILISYGFDNVIASLCATSDVLSIQARFTSIDATEYRLRFR